MLAFDAGKERRLVYIDQRGEGFDASRWSFLIYLRAMRLHTGDCGSRVLV